MSKSPKYIQLPFAVMNSIVYEQDIVIDEVGNITAYPGDSAGRTAILLPYADLASSRSASVELIQAVLSDPCADDLHQATRYVENLVDCMLKCELPRKRIRAAFATLNPQQNYEK